MLSDCTTLACCQTASITDSAHTVIPFCASDFAQHNNQNQMEADKHMRLNLIQGLMAAAKEECTDTGQPSIGDDGISASAAAPHAVVMP
jgi:hypothetical protein